MKELQHLHHKTEIVFGIEPTGHYWFSLAAFLETQGIKIVIVNPHHVNKSKELEDNSPTKSDYKDAKVIADLMRNGKYSEPRLPTKEYAELRILMNFREKVIVSLNQVKARIQNWLDRYFPEYLSVFKEWEGKASLMTNTSRDHLYRRQRRSRTLEDGNKARSRHQESGETLHYGRNVYWT